CSLEPYFNLRALGFTLAAFPSRNGGSVTDSVVLQYLGFQTNSGGREYAFTLRGPNGESSEYFVTIASAAFVENRVRYQDAPDICSLKLRKEFAAQPGNPPANHFCISNAELADYKDAHTPKPKASFSRREDHEL